MKVLQVNSVFGQGSTGRIVQDVARALHEGGHDPLVAYGRGHLPAETGVVRLGSDAEVLRHVAATRLSDGHGLASPGATRELIQYIRRERPDIVHLHNIHGYYLNYPVLFSFLKEWSAPVVWTLHDCWAFTGHCAYFDYVGCDRWKTECHSCPQRGSYPAAWVDRSPRNFRAKSRAFTGHGDLTLVTPSNWLASLVQESLLSEYPRRVIRNDPDVQIFKPTPGTWRERLGLQGKFVILGVANIWEPRKGLDALLALAQRLRPSEALVVVGRLPPGVRLPHGVVHVPHTADARELAQIYSDSDVYLNPTLEDNYPTTNLEALACGTPVVTFDCGGSAETLERGWGRVALDRSAAGLRTAVDDIATTIAAGQSAGTAGASLLTPGSLSMAERYLALYESVLERRTSGTER